MPGILNQALRIYNQVLQQVFALYNQMLKQVPLFYNQMLKQSFVFYNQMLGQSNQILSRSDIDRSYFIVILMMLIMTVLGIITVVFLGWGFRLGARRSLEKAMLTK